VATDLAALVASLDLPTKVRLLTGATTFTLAPEPSIGLGELRLSDGPTGVRGLKFSGGRVVACLPNATLIASAWSEDTADEVGGLLAEEALAQQVHVVLGPTINLHRSALGGRLFEAYSEDPLLTGRLAAAYVRGMQRRGVGACLKHLVANESETERDTVNSVVDEATLRELYLLPFEIAVVEADPWSMMAAYNDVNGVAATEQHHVNNEIVKDEWSWTGLIMSDWFATKTAGPSANGGLDLVMPGPGGPWGDALVSAVTAGEVAESVVDDHLRRLLLLAQRCGALGDLREYPEGLPAPDSQVRREQLTRLAASGMTVLTNRDRALPLVAGQNVALIGRHALETATMGGGSAQVNAPYHVSVAEGLAALLGEGSLTVTDGVEVRTRQVPARPEFVTDPHTDTAGVGFTLLAGDGSVLETRHSTSATTLVGFDDGLGGLVASVELAARVAVGGPIDLGVLGVGSWELRVGGQTHRWDLKLSGSGMGEEILNPPIRSQQVVVSAGELVEATVTLGDGSTSGTGVAMLGLIARSAPRDQDEVIADAALAARHADVAVVVVGLTEEQETESVDKHTLVLPGRQDELVRAVAAAARRTVVVVNAATPTLMPWADEVDAVLWAGLPGQEGGHAVAAALLGTIEPAGRLVTTFPVEDGAAPAWSVTPVDGAVTYDEGTVIGYRGHHAGRAPAPAFWFGHGLGYSSWQYSDPGLRAGDAGPVVTVTVTNTGDRVSREVVQVYFDPRDTEQPIRLVGWSAVEVAPSASVDVTVTCDRRLWRRWNIASAAWEQLPDDGRLVVARGLGDVRGTVALES
jgi:beta-glucosidase